MQVIAWLRHGAPAGILTSVDGCDIFPEYKPEVDMPAVDVSDLSTPLDFVNYYGVEDCSEAAAEMARLKACGYVHEAQSWEETVAYHNGAEPILSKIGLIIRERNGKRKVRMVVDSKQSMVPQASRKWQRMQLPTIRHAVYDMLELLKDDDKHSMKGPEELEHMIADVKDAFFLVPNFPQERRFFVVSFRGKYYTWLKSAQGSTAAPLTWARVAQRLLG